MWSIEHEVWVDRARAVHIEDELARRNIKVSGKTERNGPCPKCGGDDRFAINIKKQLFNCRGCKVGGDIIDFVGSTTSMAFASYPIDCPSSLKRSAAAILLSSSKARQKLTSCAPGTFRRLATQWAPVNGNRNMQNFFAMPMLSS